MVARLRRHRNDEADAAELADRLDFCVQANPCVSGACPICCRAHQRWLVDRGAKLIAGLSGSHQLVAMSLVPDFGRCEWNRLDQFDLTAFNLKVNRALKDSNVKLTFGGVDFSLNVDFAGSVPYLQVQLYLICATGRSFRRDALRKQLNKSGRIKVPVRIARFDGSNAGLAYALKYEFCRRESYLQAAHERTDGRVSMNTRNRPIRGRAAVQLTIMLDRIGLSDRLFLFGSKRIWKNEEVNLAANK